MIDRLTMMYQGLYAHFLSWYQAADLLTQYVIIIVSALIAFLLSVFMILSRITK